MSGGGYVQEVVTHPPDMGPQGVGTHPVLDMGCNGYGRQADVMHSTGMLSCLNSALNRKRVAVYVWEKIFIIVSCWLLEPHCFLDFIS